MLQLAKLPNLCLYQSEERKICLEWQGNQSYDFQSLVMTIKECFANVCSDKGLTINASALKLFTVANLHYQLS